MPRRYKTAKDVRLPYKKCMSMKVSDIRKTREYELLTPLGVKNKSGHYRFGNKSYLNKKNLCLALDNPAQYHKKIQEKRLKKVNAGPRKRSTRKGDCPTKRKVPCSGSHPHKGLTTTGKPCCYKIKQSAKVTKKRMAVRKSRSTSK